MLLTHGKCRALIGYLFIFVLTILAAGCGGGGSDPATGTPPPPPPGGTTPTAFVNIVANAGPIVAVRVDATVTLDGSSSTSTVGPMTYAWSFSSKPDASNAELQNATTASPSFVADAWGAYMVQLVVSAGGVSSQRSIALVVVTNDGERLTGPFNHPGLSSNCVNCHNSESTIVGKSGDHVATSNLCQACHTPLGFTIIPFADHQEVFGNCSTCHDGVSAIGKSEFHVPTNVECDDCHNTTSFLELELDGSFDHSNISRACAGCHNGIVAIGKNEGHIATDGECNSCHIVDSFIPAFFDHSVIDFAVQSCVSCHDGDGPGISTVGKTANHPATSDNCEVCHNTQTFDLGGVFNHDVIDDEAIQCESCHDGNHVGAGAREKTSVQSGHPDTTADCGACHNTRDFADFYVDHTSTAVTSVRCDSCHGVTAIGMPSPNHILLTTEDCSDCHTPGNFATGSFDHTAVEADPNVECASCHDDVITVGKIGNHVPTNADCRACHGTDTFTVANFDHTLNDVANRSCDSCHDGEISTGKKVNHILTLGNECNACHATTGFTPSTFLTGVHTNITSDCQSCHNGTIATGKPGRTHIPTQDDCSTCHITSSFVGATFDHAGVTRGCEGCHNGRFTTATDTIKGKPVLAADHVPTNQDCYICHDTSPDWATSAQTVFAHVGITGNCTSCHDGTYVGIGALEKTTVQSGHPDTTADCGACHTTTAVAPNGVSFLNFFVDHTNFVDNCGSAGCHDANSDVGIYAASTEHGPTNGNDCELCHTAGVAWVPAVFDHSSVSRNTRCDSCHNGTDSIGKAAKTNPTHIPTTEDCRLCHNTTAFAGATFDHQGITNNCESCHNGNTATGKPNNHVPTNGDCADCHQTTGFVPATFDHVGIVDNCESCHDGVLAIGKVDANNHPATNQDCGVCHSIGDTFAGATFDHTGITNNCARSGCHDGSPNGSTYKPNNHVETTLDCSNCHTTATFVGGTWFHDASTAGNCLDCHVTGGGATPQPTRNHFVTGPNVQCDACHTTDGWGDQGTFDHCPNTNANNNTCNGSDYPGDHRAGKAACIDCHTNNTNAVSYPNQAQYAPFCAGCHAGDFRREGDHIGGNNGTVEQNKNCGASGCHRVSSNGF